MPVALEREFDVEGRMADILEKFVGKKFNGVTIFEVKRQYEIDNRRVDVAVLTESSRPLLIIETKKKYEVRGFRAERRFIVTSSEVLGQAFSYAAILKGRHVHVPFVATANDRYIALFVTPDDIDSKVNRDAVENRDYERVLSSSYVYELRNKYLLFHKPVRFTEDFFAEVLETITGIYVKRYAFEEKRQELHYTLIEELRGFVDFLTPYVQDAIAPNGKFNESVARAIEEYVRSRGYGPTPEQLAREMAYVLLNKVIFYKVLENYYGKLERLTPLYKEGGARSVSEYLAKLEEMFEKAIEIAGDFEPIFKTGIYDMISIVESEEVLKALDWLVELIDVYKIEKFGDIIGYVYRSSYRQRRGTS
ncbi:MAG: hypothetical protein P3X22_007915 [Thermoprotei archaeon]|nr:hypothetical protein [Thermoprotei archaeon]